MTISCRFGAPTIRAISPAKPDTFSDWNEDELRKAMVKRSKPIPQEIIDLDRSIIRLMSDGRERTACDIATRLPKVSFGAMAEAVNRLVRAKCLTYECVRFGKNETTGIYKSAEEARAAA
jgi:hypothetical protein